VAPINAKIHRASESDPSQSEISRFVLRRIRDEVPRGVRVVLPHESTPISFAVGWAVFNDVLPSCGCVHRPGRRSARRWGSFTQFGCIGPGGRSTGPVECVLRSTLWPRALGTAGFDQKNCSARACVIAASLLIELHQNFHAHELPFAHTKRRRYCNGKFIDFKRCDLDWRMHVRRL
jgi:hypothetical protein